MPTDELQSQENIFKAMAKSAVNRKSKSSNLFEFQY